MMKWNEYNKPVSLVELLFIANKNSPKDAMVSWETQDGLIHINSLQTINKVAESDIDFNPNMQFKIWVKEINHAQV